MSRALNVCFSRLRDMRRVEKKKLARRNRMVIVGEQNIFIKEMKYYELKRF